MVFKQRVKQLSAEFAIRHTYLQNEFRLRLTSLVQSMYEDILKRAQMPVSSSKPKRKAAPMDDDDTLNLTRHPSKRQKFVKLLEDGTGVWVRRDSDHSYVCKGEADVADHFNMQQLGSSKIVKVSLVALLSKWNHIP